MFLLFTVSYKFTRKIEKYLKVHFPVTMLHIVGQYRAFLQPCSAVWRHRGIVVASLPYLRGQWATVCNTAVSSTALHSTVQCYAVLHCTALCYTTMHCTAVPYTALYCTAVHCTVLCWTLAVTVGGYVAVVGSPGGAGTGDTVLWTAALQPTVQCAAVYYNAE